MSTTTRPRFTISEGESTDLWVAKEEQTGIVSQGSNPSAALDNLQEALELYHRPDSEEAAVTEASAPWFE
ncbi:hypothetical protein MUK72_08355 [Halococcus dombrowskii]|uniref:Type II toxin-antitoxin system HicB family antitoxin n=1 Tax=Halococcus dombrowskii TaxID=179637 RepID=A0AAV3SHX7_HALDO|nr:hypothetical protein [Halococcus dombrowskii]UOO93982.1 hypothetical protein MUK72_08355 [Halococcus dombrowskii]